MNINLTKILLTLPMVSIITFPAASLAASPGVLSKVNEVQTNLKKSQRSKLPVMPETGIINRSVKKPVGRAMLMPKVTRNINIPVIKKTKLTGKLTSMPAYNTRSVQVSKGKGLQQGKQTMQRIRMAGKVGSSGKNMKKGNSYLHVVMEVSKNGNVRVLSAVKVKGTPVNTREALGDFIYNVKIANKGVLVQAIPDPFEMRSFPGPAGSGLTGHHFEQAPTARLVVKIPAGKAILRKLSTIKMDLYKLKPGSQIRTIDQKTLKKLQFDKRLKTIVKLPSLKLAPQIKQKLILPVH